MMIRTNPSIEERFEIFDIERIFDGQDIDRVDMKRQWRDWQCGRGRHLYYWPLTVTERCFSRYLKGYLIVSPRLFGGPEVKKSQGYSIYNHIIDKIHNAYYMHDSTKKAYNRNVDISTNDHYAKVIYDGEIIILGFKNKNDAAMLIKLSNRINLIKDIENANNRKFTSDII